jgi:uncharacterized membrane protein
MRFHGFLILVVAGSLGACAPVADKPGAVAPAATVGAGSAIPAPVLDSEQNVAEAFVLSTNEPFWSASVDANTLVLAGLEGKRTLAVDSNKRLFDGRLVMAHDSAGRLEVRITERTCQDSMSGALYPYTGKMAFDGGKEIFGCARPASDPQPGEPGDDRRPQ